MEKLLALNRAMRLLIATMFLGLCFLYSPAFATQAGTADIITSAALHIDPGLEIAVATGNQQPATYKTLGTTSLDPTTEWSINEAGTLNAQRSDDFKTLTVESGVLKILNQAANATFSPLGTNDGAYAKMAIVPMSKNDAYAKKSENPGTGVNTGMIIALGFENLTANNTSGNTSPCMIDNTANCGDCHRSPATDANG